MKTKLLLLALPLMSFSTLAADVNFSIGAGMPYFLIPEVSMPTDDKTQRLYANYKIGLDDGFSVGFEKAVSDNRKHSFGALLGALGVRDTNVPCESTSNQSSSIFIDVDALGCALDQIFDDKTVNGLGITYGYSFNGLNSRGFRLVIGVGYGKRNDIDKNGAAGSISLNFEF